MRARQPHRPGIPGGPGRSGAQGCLLAALLMLSGCSSSGREDDWTRKRLAMVRVGVEGWGVRDERVLAAMRKVPRHLFVPQSERAAAYENHPLPIGHGQTISQPYIVGLMSECLRVKPGDRVLEVGTGSGYQAAVLAEMGLRVFTIEIVEPLAVRAGEVLASLGYDQATVRVGDGYAGWPDEAPFDGIIVTAAPPTIPEALERQLAVGARLVIPVGTARQKLLVITRTPTGFERSEVARVAFVPMVPGPPRRRD